MERLGPGLLMLALALALMGLVLVGWRGRLRRQSGIAAPAPVPDAAALGAERLRCSGQYVVTTGAGDWLDRIAVHRLGLRTTADAVVYDVGLVLERAGAPDLFIAAGDLDGVRLEAGMAGKFVEEGGLVVVAWRLGGTAVDTGFRPRRAQEKNALVAAIGDLVRTAPRDGDGEGKSEQ